MHKTHEALASELTAAKEEVQVGGSYYHYKNPADLYRVVNVAITEWDDEVCVIYETQYGENITFVRPLSSWLETVDWLGSQVDRFTLVEG